jgi:hypothetical protein
VADNVGYTPGSGATVAADDIAGVLHQRVKLSIGDDGVAVDLSASNPMPITAITPVPTDSQRTDALLVMLSRVVKLLESNAVVDAAQRQRISVDSFPATIPALTTVTTVTTVTTLSNAVAVAGMDREQWINAAKQTYAQSIRARLTFQ